MQLQNPSQIFKSELRGIIATNSYNCLSTLNYNGYQLPSREPYGNLMVINEEILAGLESILYHLEDDQSIIILPLVGTIELEKNTKLESISIHQIYSFSIQNGETFRISNPYERDLISFIQIRFHLNYIKESRCDFDFKKRNEVIILMHHEEFSISIGIFDARIDNIYKLRDPQKGLFVFILNGAFEFQNRLLENRDGLKIWNVQEIEFEALSENAMLLIIEVLV